MSRVALLMNPANANAKVEQADAEAGAKKLGLETVTLLATNAQEINAALEQLLSAKADAFITATDPMLLDRREQIVSFADRHKLPAVGYVRQFAAAGALSSYGPSISWVYRQAGEYVGQDSERFKPGGNACPAADAIRAGDQPQNGQGFRPDHSGYFPCPRRRGDRITRQMSAIGTERTWIGDA